MGWGFAVALWAAGASAAPDEEAVEGTQPCLSPCAIRHASATLSSADREVPLRVTWPLTEERLPLIVFSHGLGGSADGYRPLVDHWAARGFVVVQPTHADSFGLLSAKEKRAIFSGKDFAANPANTKNWAQRPAEVSLVLDQLDAILAQVGLEGRVDAERVGVGGHSFGAHTTLMIGGLRMTSGPVVAEAPDPRAKALVVLSPQGTGPGVTAASFEPITAPTLMVTGTNDTSPRNGKKGSWRRGAFEALPSGDHALLWLDGAHHNLGGVSGVRYPGAAEPDPELLEEVLAVTARFWQAQLWSDATAAEALTQTKSPRARVERK